MIKIEAVSIRKTIQMTKELTNELIDISKIRGDKYPFMEEYGDLLIKKIKANPGKFLISLEDLPQGFILKFSNKGDDCLKDLLNFIKNRYGLDRINRKYGINFYLINDSIIKRNGGLKIGTLRKYIKFLSDQRLNTLSMDEINENIIQIKSNIKSKAIKIDGLPLDLRDEKWAPIFGIILDTHLKEFKFVAKDRDLAESVRFSLREVGIEPYFKDLDTLVKIKGHSIIRHIVDIAGIETNKKQLIANNCLPSWMFLCSKKYHKILLSKFLDTEGYVPNGGSGIRIAQASFINLTKKEKEFVLSNSKTKIIRPSNKESKVVIFSRLNEKLKKKVLLNPPMILLSTQLLLRKYRINSKLYPIKLYISTNGIASASWHLAIIGFSELRKFYNLCEDYISIGYKKGAIKKILVNQKRKCLPMGLRIVYYLINAKKVQGEKGYFTTKNLVSMTKKNKKTVYNIIGYLAQYNLIETINKKGHVKLWNITKKGINYLENTCKNKEEMDYLFK